MMIRRKGFVVCVTLSLLVLLLQFSEASKTEASQEIQQTFEMQQQEPQIEPPLLNSETERIEPTDQPPAEEPPSVEPNETPVDTTRDYQYVYDENNRLTQILKNGTLLQSFTYDPNGNLQRITYEQQ